MDSMTEKMSILKKGKKYDISKINDEKSFSDFVFNSQYKDSFDFLSMDYDRFKFTSRGTYGLVFRAWHKASGSSVAVKMVTNMFRNEITSKQLVTEIQILRKLSKIKTNVFTTILHDIVVKNDMF